MEWTIDDLEQEVLGQSRQFRARLALQLIHSLDQGDGRAADEVEQLWLREAEGRCRQIDAGAVELLPAEEVLGRLRAKLA